MKKSLLYFLMLSVFAVFSFALELPANKVVDVAWVKKNMNNPNVVLVMTDSKGEVYKKGHIPGSVLWDGKSFNQKQYDLILHLPTPLQFKRLAQKSGISNDSIVVFYGSNANFKESARPLEGLVVADYYGVDNAVYLNGGLAAWGKAGEAVETKAVKPAKSTFEIKKMNDVIATLEDIDAAVETKSASLIDARPGKFYKGTDKDKRLKKHGHIDGAVAIETASLYDFGDELGKFKSEPELKKMFADAGIDLSKPIIAYCNTGHLASGVWFAAKYILGAKDVKNYKASMVEYTAMPQRKVLKTN